ncbi:MAG: hypothetical protein FJZ96_11300 [Chloroflexi bacterium]|nr:hypothetical protein [Chloroflexota bacterium]
MDKCREWLGDLRWTLPVSLALGLGLSLLDGAADWRPGWGAYAFLLLLVASLLLLAWRSAGGGRFLAGMLFLAFLLRLGLGVAFTFLQPQTGYDAPIYQAGYTYVDAYQRDVIAWELAASGQSLSVIFGKEYALVDQYGGMLGFSALAYRYLSPDAHRPWLVIILSAGAYALSLAFAWRAARLVFGEKVARPLAWIYALYPETLMLGSSQMREPFLMLFIALAFWGVAAWQEGRNRRAWVWLGFGLAGMLLFSPGVAVAALVILAGWLLLGSRGRVSWKAMLLAGLAILAALGLFSWAIGRVGSVSADSVFQQIYDWFRYTARWDTYELEQISPWVDPLFKQLPESLHLPFVVVYGFLQPVLPAALIEPAPWLPHTVSILRALGWYSLAPLMASGLLAAFRVADRRLRRLWLWGGLASIGWIALSAFRSGGDLWDNPRYRAIFLLWQALLAAQALPWQRGKRGPWLGRFLVVEGIFLAFFTEWYIARYAAPIPTLPFWAMVSAIVGLSLAVLLGGWGWDIWRARRKPGREGKSGL